MTEKQFASFPRAVRTREKGSFMQELSDDQREDIAAIAGQRDEDIDYSDIPPIREIPASAVRGRFYRGPAIYLTGEVHTYFSTIAQRRGVSLSDLVNAVLSRDIAMVEELK
jgi:hypothetical protein